MEMNSVGRNWFDSLRCPVSDNLANQIILLWGKNLKIQGSWN